MECEKCEKFKIKLTKTKLELKESKAKATRLRKVIFERTQVLKDAGILPDI